MIAICLSEQQQNGFRVNNSAELAAIKNWLTT